MSYTKVACASRYTVLVQVMLRSSLLVHCCIHKYYLSISTRQDTFEYSSRCAEFYELGPEILTRDLECTLRSIPEHPSFLIFLTSTYDPLKKSEEKIEGSVCVFSSHSFWTSSSLDVPAGVTRDFSSTFFLRCVPSFFSREGFSHSFPSSTVKSNFVY